MWAATALKCPKLGGDEAVERIARWWAATARHGRKEPLALIAREGHAQLDWRWLLRLLVTASTAPLHGRRRHLLRHDRLVHGWRRRLDGWRAHTAATAAW